ncbi:MAG TPA: 50S ribosomal protein L10 [Candidatus Altiarchaeales archaeon]|nr:50S ribosomal protein L10 [Candidatus Altiarchaeales archaeon]
MVSEWKINTVEDLAMRMSKSRIVALVSISNIPSRQLQKMRKSLIGSAVLKVSRNNLIRKAFEKTGIKDMENYIKGSTGLIFSDLDPFKLKKLLEKGKTSAPIKPGQVAPDDIVVPAGDTQLPPGPVISELQSSGIKAKIEGGKIVITEDSLAAKKGDVISPQLASILARLGIEPMEIYLKLMAVYENGLIYTPDILDIGEAQVISDIEKAYKNAMNLSLNAGIYNKYAVEILIRNAFNNAMNLALNSEIINKDTIKSILSKANQQMLSLRSRIKLD